MVWSHLIDWFLCILGIGLLSAFSLASSTSLALFCFESSGLYFLNNFNKTFAKLIKILPLFFSKALENWAIVDGTLSLVNKIRFCLWKVMYFGHLTNLVRFLLGWMSLPSLKFFGLFSKRGLALFSTFLTDLFPLAPLP